MVPITQNFTLECERLGEGYVLHSALSGVIVLSNALGAEIYRYLQQGKAQGEIVVLIAADLGMSENEAQTLVSDIMGVWQEAGLLDKTRLPYEHPVVFQPLADAGHCLSIGFDERVVRIESADCIVAEQVKEIMQAYICDEVDYPAAVITVSHVSEGGFGVFRDGTPLWGCCNHDEARNLVIRELATILCGESETAAMLHAGAVMHQNGKCLVITGSSGAGKSTLTAGLVDQGLNYLADDYLPLHIGGDSVMAFPTALGLKYGAWGLPEAKALGYTETATKVTSRDGVQYRVMASTLPLASQHPVSALLFPQFGEGREEALEALSPEEALQELIIAGARVSREVNSIKPLAQFLNHVPSYKLHYTSSDDSVKACLSLLAR